MYQRPVRKAYSYNGRILQADEAAEYLKTVLIAGDSVLLKASNGMKLKEIVEGIK